MTLDRWPIEELPELTATLTQLVEFEMFFESNRYPKDIIRFLQSHHTLKKVHFKVISSGYSATLVREARELLDDEWHFEEKMDFATSEDIRYIVYHFLFTKSKSTPLIKS